jgi:hypothetical protein
MTVDMAAYRRAYLDSERTYDHGCHDEFLIAAIEDAAATAVSERAVIIEARNAVHDFCCPITTWRCGDDRAQLARHRAMYRAQAVAMLAAIREAACPS